MIFYHIAEVFGFKLWVFHINYTFCKLWCPSNKIFSLYRSNSAISNYKKVFDTEYTDFPKNYNLSNKRHTIMNYFASLANSLKL